MLGTGRTAEFDSDNLADAVHIGDHDPMETLATGSFAATDPR